MHGVYLSHLREIANVSRLREIANVSRLREIANGRNGSRHAIAINQNLCQKYLESTGGKGGGQEK